MFPNSDTYQHSTLELGQDLECHEIEDHEDRSDPGTGHWGFLREETNKAGGAIPGISQTPGIACGDGCVCLCLCGGVSPIRRSSLWEGKKLARKVEESEVGFVTPATTLLDQKPRRDCPSELPGQGSFLRHTRLHNPLLRIRSRQRRGLLIPGKPLLLRGEEGNCSFLSYCEQSWLRFSAFSGKGGTHNSGVLARQDLIRYPF